MQLTKEIFLLLSLCLSCTAVVSDESPETTSTTTSAETTTESTTSDGNFGELSANLDTLATTLTSNITDMETLVSESKNSIRKAALESGAAALKGLNENIASLKDELTKMDAEIGDDLDATITKTLADLDTWATEQLALASKGTTQLGITKANNRIQSVVRTYNANLPRTTDNFSKSKVNYERQVNGSIKIYTTYAQNLMAEMNACNATAARLCESRIKTLVLKVNTSKAELNRLTKAGDTVVNSGKAASRNLTTQLARLKNDQQKCESDLKLIKKNYKDENADDLDETEDSGNSTDTDNSNDNQNADADKSSEPESPTDSEKEAGTE